MSNRTTTTFSSFPSSECQPALPEAWAPKNAGARAEPLYINKILLWCQEFGQEFIFVSAEVCDSRNRNFRSNIASFEHRLRRVAPTPLAMPCPFRTTLTRTNAERDKREVAKYRMSRRNFGEFRRFWLNVNVCNAWMINKIGIISKRYLLDNVWNFAVACATYYCSVNDCAPAV